MKKAATLLVLTTFLYLYSDKTFKGMANVEIWKDIPAYMGYYQASNLGQIRRLDSQSWKGRILKQRTAHNGYKRIELCMNNIRKAHPVHRLIAQAFIPNPENKPMINHKNGIRDDNRLENIEWCTNSENQLHSFRELGRVHLRPLLGRTGVLCKNSKSVNQFDLDGNLIKFWEASSDAARHHKINQSNISACCRGKSKTCVGFKWKYA